MTIFQAIILGIVQGLTEFIPVSSTAHLVFAARLVNLYGGVDKTLQAEQTTATIAVVQLGTLLAVLVYFSRDIVNILRGFVIATMMIVVGVLMAIAELVGRRERGMTQLRVGDALAVGSAQVLALIPGSS